MEIKEIFSRTNIVIFLLILLFLSLIFLLFYKGRDIDVFEERKGTEEQLRELEVLKDDLEYSPPSVEEIEKQVNELKDLRYGKD